MSTEENKINALTSGIALLEQHRKPHTFSTLITLLSVLMLLYMGITSELSFFWLVAMAVIIALGMVEMIYAIRVGFDLELLRKLVSQTEGIETGLQYIDDALMQLQLIKPGNAGRSLGVRLSGCIRLLKTQLVLSVLQVIAILVSAILYLFM